MLAAHRILGSVALLFVASCADLGPATSTDTVLRTDSARYTATTGGFSLLSVRLITTYRNPADTTVTLERCTPTTPYPIYFVQLIAPASPEGAAYNPDWACVGHNNPIVVAPRAVRTDTIILHGPTAFDNTTGKYVGVIAGTFRISYGGQQSNAFSIVLPPGVP